MWIIIALFVLYFLLVTWQMRRAVGTEEPAARLSEAKRLLLLVAAGLPLVAALIVVAL